VAFVDELAQALHARGKLLSVTVPPILDTGRTPDSGAWVYDQHAIGEVADQVRVMAYDFSTAKPGPIGPLAWTRTVLRASKKAIGDDSKIVLGIPLYGRNWVVGTAGQCPPDASGKVDVKLVEAADLAAKRGATPVHDPVTGEATFTYQLQVTGGTLTCTQTREVHYVDEQGVRARVDLARRERIGGVVFWALGFDSDATWQAVTAVARPKVPPAGTAASGP
jgi:spore germination protein YaaH